jgi:hypothetical protein
MRADSYFKGIDLGLRLGTVEGGEQMNALNAATDGTRTPSYRGGVTSGMRESMFMRIAVVT